jgi:HK97 family phage portal protein
VDNGGIFGKYNALWYVWTDSKTGKQYSFSAEEILHFKTHMSFDGISGMATKDILKTQIESLQYSQQYQGKLFKNNLFGGKIILQYTDNMNTTGKDLLIKETERYANSVGSGKFLPIPLGIQASTLDMKLSDAEFVELNKLNTLQLASAFGIKPNILNDYSKSSYSNSETQQLDFYVNSLQPIFNMYQQEITRKLLSPSEKNKNYFFEIDKEILFELDKSTQMEVLNKGVNNFMITPNEAREKLGLPWVDGGDELVGNGNYIKLSQVGTQWNNANLKGGDKIEK